MIVFTKFNSLVDIALYFDTPAKCKKAIAESRFEAMFKQSLGVFDYKGCQDGKGCLNSLFLH